MSGRVRSVYVGLAGLMLAVGGGVAVSGAGLVTLGAQQQGRRRPPRARPRRRLLRPLSR